MAPSCVLVIVRPCLCGANATEAKQADATMRISAAGTALVAAAVVCPVTGNAIVAANRLATVIRALAVTGTGATEAHATTAGGTTAGAANWPADVARAFQPAAAIRTTEASPTLIAAAVQRPITGDAIVCAGDRPAVLVAFTRSGALASEPNRTPARRCAIGADSALTPHVAAALRIC